MELHNQIRKYRTSLNLSQDELAEKIFVTRQTISNWETNKNYPDIHSLLLLSSLFQISLDELIKGDVTIMKQEIDANELQKFNRDGVIFTILLILIMISTVPLAVFLGFYGLIITALLGVVATYYAKRIEKYKKSNDIQTYKEIVAFMNGKRLDEIEKAQESGKRPYQKYFLAFLCGFITLIVCLIFIWLLRSFIF